MANEVNGRVTKSTENFDMACSSVSFDRIIGHDMSERELLGAPGWFTELQQRVISSMSELRHADIWLLYETLTDPRRQVEARLAAGNVLAWVGDSRIDPFDPAMCDIAAAVATIGLPEKDLESKALELRPLGVDAAWVRKEVPQHEVLLARYRIARFPVTHAEYRTFLDETGQFDRLPSSWSLGRYPAERSNHPVHGIRPTDADAYASWLSRRTGRHFRLPREAEWEFAAAGRTRSEYPWPGPFDPEKANTAELGWLQSSPVGAFPAGQSWCGALDMAGNVEEFVADTYAPYPGGELVQDDLYLQDPAHRIARGGSYARFHDLARTSRRHGHIGASPVYAFGFRLAEDV